MNLRLNGKNRWLVSEDAAEQGLGVRNLEDLVVRRTLDGKIGEIEMEGAIGRMT